MATQEKQKKGFLYFYKSSTKKHKPKSQPAVVTTNDIESVVTQPHRSLQKKLENYQEIEPVVTTNKPAAVTLQSSHNLLLKKLENSQDIEHGGQRRNFVEARKSVSHVETNLASVISFLQVKVLVSDMPGSMQVHAFRCARRTYDSLEKFSSKHIAYNIKKEFDKVYGPAWHCIVGSAFGSYVTHSTGCFLYFSMENLYILVFKTKVQKALD